MRSGKKLRKLADDAHNERPRQPEQLRDLLRSQIIVVRKHIHRTADGEVSQQPSNRSLRKPGDGEFISPPPGVHSATARDPLPIASHTAKRCRSFRPRSSHTASTFATTGREE